MNNTTQDNKTWPFVVTIDDGYSAYEYKFDTTEDVSIYDIAKKISEKLKCSMPEGKLT